MKATYFVDTDTLVLHFTDKLVEDYVDVGDADLMELDGDGEIIGLTLEHAEERNILPDFEFERVMGGVVEIENIGGKWVEVKAVEVQT
jgi:uncharacterized protein YuzE